MTGLYSIGRRDSRPRGEAMKRYAELVLILSLLFCTSAIAQTDLTGTWQGKLATSPNEKMTIQFMLKKKANGLYAATLNSPDNGAIKNVPATAVKLAGDKLTIEVASLNGSYSGTVGKGTITGEWKQEGSILPLVLIPYKVPSVGTLKPLLGEWIGEVAPPGAGKIITVFRFEMTKDGKFAGFMDVPEQGAKGIPVSDVLLEGNQVTFKIANAQAEYAGKLSVNKIEGAAKQAGQEFQLNLVKGKYEPPAYTIPAEDMKKLLGEWTGSTGTNKLTIVFRFETTRTGKLAVSMDVPDQGARGVTAKDFTLKGDEIKIALPGSSGDNYTGKLSGNSMKGTFKLNNNNQELNLAKGAKYRPGINDIPLADMNRLLGQWVGKYAPGGPTYTIIWTFEKTKDGKLSAMARAPETGPDVFPITNISLKGDQLNFRIPATGGEFTGKLNNNSLSGTYKASGAVLQLAVTRGAKYDPTTQKMIPPKQ
jgi:hypothetical protein